MPIAALLLLVGLGQLPQAAGNPDPDGLVAQLGAPRFADRQAAAATLERLGAPPCPPSALPVNRATWKSRPGLPVCSSRSKRPS